jgi:hypothetical protein
MSGATERISISGTAYDADEVVLTVGAPCTSERSVHCHFSNAIALCERSCATAMLLCKTLANICHCYCL